MYSLRLEREPCAESLEARRKPVDDITQTTIFYRRLAKAEAEKQAGEEKCKARELYPGDMTICKVVKGHGGGWLLEHVGNGEVFVMLEPDSWHDLPKGLCLRFGNASAVTPLTESV